VHCVVHSAPLLPLQTAQLSAQPSLETELHCLTSHVCLTAFAIECFSADICTIDDYGALEPAISGKIMELHHDKHHRTYVNSYNAAQEKMEEIQAKGDIQAQLAQQSLINFHGGVW
jgi:hypothetical protein